MMLLPLGSKLIERDAQDTFLVRLEPNEMGWETACAKFSFLILQ